ncbi:thioredoxin family protein [Pelomonas sp. KK5]|uniref:thioredoxin family protein n=1 Tax=Pelomonas sp. KK5 TaxID=1855730 RepID=UPI00097BCC71
MLPRSLAAPFGALAVALLAAVSLAGPAASSEPLPALDGATGWINSPPLTAQALRGKVVLVDFWTYSCINCLRTLPYVRAWAQKYGPNGLVVIGAHTPEFSFERSTANVQRAVRDLHIDYPVAVDSEYALWKAFGTRAWPSFFFVDANGRIRGQQLGEGRYDQAERMIQQLLREAGRQQVPSDLVAPQGEGTQAAAAPRQPSSDETYLGTARAEGYVAGADARSLALNQWTLAGNWHAQAEQVELDSPTGRIAYRFRARDLHLVLGPARGGKPVRFRVRIDGMPPGADHGSDTDAEGFGTVDAHRLYQLVRQSRDETRPRLFEIEFLDPGVRAHAFTFG